MSEDEKFNVLEPDSKISDLVQMAKHELKKNNFDAFEFDIHGFGPNGPVVMHFEVAAVSSSFMNMM